MVEGENVGFVRPNGGGVQVQPAQDAGSPIVFEESQTSSRRGWIIGGVCFVVVIVAVFLAVIHLGSMENLSIEDIEMGKAISLEAGNKVIFKFAEEDHSISVGSVGDSSVEIIIQSEIIRAMLNVGESKSFDLDGDGVDDLSVKLERIVDGEPVLFVKKFVAEITGENLGVESSENETVIISNNESNVSEVRTCVGDGGYICNSTEVCGGNLLNVSDSNFCCDEICVVKDVISDSSGIQLGITLPKTSYEIGEVVSGDYFLSYEGESFKGIVLYTYSRNECNENQYAKALGLISTGSFEDGTLSMFKTAFQAFRYDKVDGSAGYCSYMGGTDSFYEEGTYIYTLSVYDCSVVENELEKDCSDADSDELMIIVPIKSVSEEVIVAGGESSTECENNNDCTVLCEGCTGGKQICRLPSGICSDCIFSCNDGYACEEYSCVLSE